jgi:acyl-CoA thioester hydrolase
MAREAASGDYFAVEMARDPGRRRALGRVTLRVRYAETDRMGVVFNAHYLTWFEIGRTELLRSAGTPYRSVEERGLNLPLVEASLRLNRPIRYDDTIVVETWIDQLRSRSICFSYRILCNGRQAAEGATTHACVRAEDGRAVSFPDWLAVEIRKLID